MRTLPDINRGSVIEYYIPSKVDMKKLAEEMSQDDLTTLYTLLIEATFQVVDGITRESGKLTKCLRVVDLIDVKINQKYCKMEANAAAIFEDSYPQLVGSMVIVNPPRWFYFFWRMFRILLPKRLKEKINFASPIKNPSDKKLFYDYISEEDLPKRYGGKNEVWPPKFAGEYYEKKSVKKHTVSFNEEEEAGRCQGKPLHRFNKSITGTSSFNIGISLRMKSLRMSLSKFSMGASFRRGISYRDNDTFKDSA